MCALEALSSIGVSCTQEENLVSQGLQGNGYPKEFIQKYTCLQSDRKIPRDHETCGSVTSPTSVDCPSLSIGR